MGTAYSMLNESNHAFEAFSQALVIEPEEFDLWYNRGLASLLTSRIGRAYKVSVRQLRYVRTMLITIGDYLRKRRLDLGLGQKEVARTLGVSTWTISNWESNPVEPEVRLMPSVIEFLGYVPCKRGETHGERIAIYRKTLGLNHTQLAKKLGVARSTVFGWEKDQVKNVEKKLRPYLDGLLEFD